METRAPYLLVGTFVLLLFCGIIGFVIWLGNFQLDRVFARYDIVVNGSVSGLKVAGQVELNGIPVGEVVSIRIDESNVEQVIVTVEVPTGTPIKTDTRASLHFAGITGGLKLQLGGGTQAAAPLKPEPGQENAVIFAQSSSFDELLEGAPELLENLQLLSRRAAQLLNPQNQQAFADTLQHVSVFSGSLANRADDIDLLITDASAAMSNIRESSVALKDLAGTLTVAARDLTNSADEMFNSVSETSAAARSVLTKSDPQIDALLTDLRGSANAITNMSNEIEAMVAENREPIQDFTGEGLYALTNFLVEARGLAVGLNRVTTEVKRDPARFLFGDQNQGYEAGSSGQQ